MRRKKSSPPSQQAAQNRNKPTTTEKQGKTVSAHTKNTPPRHPAPKPPPKTPDIRGTLLYGHHAVAAAWDNPARQIHALYVAEGTRPEWLEAALERKQLKQPHQRPAPFSAPRSMLDQLTRDGVHQGIVADVAPLPELGLDDVLDALPQDAPALFLMLDQVSDPQNIGSILRAAAAFGAKAVIAQERHAPPITATMAKIASGAVEHVPYIQVTNLSRSLEQLAAHHILGFGFDERGAHVLGEAPLPARHVLVLGAEGSGLRRLVAAHCHQIVRLPTQPPIASLNVAQAATIALYESTRQARTAQPSGEAGQKVTAIEI